MGISCSIRDPRREPFPYGGFLVTVQGSGFISRCNDGGEWKSQAARLLI